MAAKLFISDRNTVVFITFAILIPASSRIAFAFVSDCLVCSLMPPGANSPVAGSIGSCPEVITSPLASIAWLYGPMAFGALFVFITFIIMVFINCYYTLIRCVWGAFFLSASLILHKGTIFFIICKLLSYFFISYFWKYRRVYFANRNGYESLTKNIFYVEHILHNGGCIFAPETGRNMANDL